MSKSHPYRDACDCAVCEQIYHQAEKQYWYDFAHPRYMEVSKACDESFECRRDDFVTRVERIQAILEAYDDGERILSHILFRTITLHTHVAAQKNADPVITHPALNQKACRPA